MYHRNQQLLHKFCHIPPLPSLPSTWKLTILEVMPDCVHITVQDKSTSNFLISNNKIFKIGSSPSDITNNSTMNNEINIAGSSKNTTSSVYATEEANVIFLVLGDAPLLLEKYDCAKVLYKHGNTSDDFNTFLIDMQSKLQRQVLQQNGILCFRCGARRHFFRS